jgi:hypothetical protein
MPPTHSPKMPSAVTLMMQKVNQRKLDPTSLW